MKNLPDDRRLAELSALFDGEATGPAAGALVGTTARDTGLRETWRVYALIGDRLREDDPGTPDMTASVMARLAEAPVVLSPRRLQPRPQHPFLAIAASLAGVAVVGWLALAENPQMSPREARIAAAVPPAPTFVQPVAAQEARQGDMNEYLLAHHTQAAGFRLGDSTEHVRTVSMAVAPARR